MKYFSPSLLDGSVTEAKLAFNSVGEANIISGAVRARTILDGVIEQGHLNTLEVSTNGTLGAGNTTNIPLVAYCLWPMIFVGSPSTVHVSGHGTNSPGADNPRFSLHNSSGVGQAYDVDYRYIVI